MEIKSIIWSIILLSSIISCKKSSDSSEPVLSILSIPQQIFKGNSKINRLSLADNAGPHQFGNTIIFLKPGNVIKVGCCMPTAGNYTVSFWEVINGFQGTKLAETIVTTTNNFNFVYKDIPPVQVSIDKSYVISVNTRENNNFGDYYVFDNSNNEDIYPFTVGDIKYINARSKVSSPTVFPSIVLGSQKIFGIPDLQFVSQ